MRRLPRPSCWGCRGLWGWRQRWALAGPQRCVSYWPKTSTTSAQGHDFAYTFDVQVCIIAAAVGFDFYSNPDMVARSLRTSSIQSPTRRWVGGEPDETSRNDLDPKRYVIISTRLPWSQKKSPLWMTVLSTGPLFRFHVSFPKRNHPKPTVEARKLEHGRPPMPNQRKKGEPA